MALITTALALAEFVPTIAGWFGGDDAEETTQQVIDVAKSVTGMDNDSDAIAAIKKDPALQIQFQQAMNPVIIARLDAETKQQAEINATMRAELSSSSWFKSGWRPALGWSVALSFAAMLFSIIFILVYGVIEKPTVIKDFVIALGSLMGSLTMLWTMAFAVLGVNVNRRSDDKALAAGHPPKPKLLSSLASKWLGKQ